MIIGRRRLEELVDTRATELAQGMIREDRVQQLARTNESAILASAVSLALRSTIDRDAKIVGNGEELRRSGTWGTGYRINGYDGNLVFAVMPYDNPQRMRLGHTEYAPLDGTFRHPRPDSGARRPIDGVDIQAWVGYVQSITDGENPAEVLDMTNDGVSCVEDRRGMRERMAGIGHKAIIRCGLKPPELVEHVQNWVEGKMLDSDEMAARHMGHMTIGLSVPVEAIAR